MKESFFNERGLYYRTNEFKEGRPTVVLMHGLSGHASAWKPYEGFLSEHVNILTFDLRGHGKSTRHASYASYAIPEFAEDLFLLLEHLGIEKFTLVTHSFGCLIALEFAKSHQEMLSSMILMSPSFAVHDLRSRMVRPFLTASRVLELLPYRAGTGNHFDYAPHREAREWDLSMTYNDVHNTGLRSYLFCSRQAFEVSYADELEQFAVPTLLIHGKEDTLFPVKNSIIMEQRMPNARAVFLDGADHIIVVNTGYFPTIAREIALFLDIEKREYH